MAIKKKNIVLIKMTVGVLFWILAFFLVFNWFGGGHFGSLGGTIGLMLLASFIAMIVPSIVWLVNRRHFWRRKGLRICIINSLILFVLTAAWPIVTIIENRPCDFGDSMCGVQFAWELLRVLSCLSVLFCVINICFWVDFD